MPVVIESALLGWAVGVALQLQQAQLWPLAVYGAVAAAAAVVAWVCFVLRRRRSIFWFAALLVSAAGLAFSWVGFLAQTQLAQALDPLLEGQSLQVTGVVSSLPQASEQGVRFRLEVEQAELSGQAVTLPPQIDLGWWTGSQRVDFNPDTWEVLPALPRVLAGERWRMTVRLKAPHGHANPHGFDLELWLWEQGVGATGSVRAGRSDAPPVLLGDSGSQRLTRWRQSVRDAIVSSSSDPATAQARGVVAALVVGDQAAIDRSDWDTFRATGVAHLMSISGLHITMFAWVAMRVMRWLWSRSRVLCLRVPAPVAARVSGVGLATLYALFSGWGVPSQRTIWMLAVMLVLQLSGRRWPWPCVWLLALTTVLLFDPWAMLQAGFWLSFVAVGVLMAADPGRTKAASTQRWWAIAKKAGAEQWTITLALTPLSLLLFHQVSVVGLLANALAIPWVTLVVTPLAMLGVLLTPLWVAATWAVHALSWVLHALAQWPGAVLSLPAAPWSLSALAVLGGVLLSLRLPWALRVFALPLMLPVLLYTVPRPTTGQFDLFAADVGQGNAVLVRTAQHSLLYDAGPRYSPDSDAGHRVLVPLLRAQGEALDVLMLSHSDIDHTGGAAAIRQMQPQVPVRSSMAAPQGDADWTRCHAGQSWVWDGVRFDVLHPLPNDYDAKRTPNAMSCVLKITGNGASALLVGDIERPQEARLTADWAHAPQVLRADVLLVPHHGSKTSSSPEWIDAVSPRVALVQAGYRNRFGHPVAQVVQRYEERGAKVVRVDVCGAWHGSSESFEFAPNQCEREVSRRYWRHTFQSN